MIILIKLLKWGLPLLLITDLSSELLASPLLLNFSRGIRMIMLFLFIKENIKYFRIIKHFYFFKFLTFFAIIHLMYLPTDPILIEGIWNFSKTLFWLSGINVLFIYGYLNYFNLSDFLKITKAISVLALIFTGIYAFRGQLETNYNVAAYIGVFIYPTILYTSDHYKKNRIYILICAAVIIITIKRGAIIAFLITNLVYYLVSLHNSFNSKKLFQGLAGLLLIITTGYFILSSQESRLKDRFSSTQIDLKNKKAASGRVGAYTNLYNEWIASNNIIFGFGNQADSHRWGTNSNRRTHAHSDIFGYTYNFGLVGISLILLFYLILIRFYFAYKKFDKNNSSIIIAFILCLFLVNLYSGLFRITEVMYFFALLPYLQLNYIYHVQKKNIRNGVTPISKPILSRP